MPDKYTSHKTPLSFNRRMVARVRSRRGNLIILSAAVAVVIALVAFPFLLKITCFSQVSRQENTAIEAASLAAAEDMAKIVVNDPHFGYIALSDYAPCGNGTVANDGEPLPVLGINTLIGTTRLQLLIAKKLDNPDLIELAQKDVKASHAAAKRLEDALRESISPGCKKVFRDADGHIVRPYEHALQLYLANFSSESSPSQPRLVNFHLSLGWLREGSGTITPIPEPKMQASVPDNAQFMGSYRAFVNIPVGTESFYFAGVAQQPALVDSQQFMPADGKRFCSIVKAESVMQLSNGKKTGKRGDKIQVCAKACAQSGALPDSSTPGVLVVSFPDGYVPGIRSIQDICVNSQFCSNQITVQRAKDGDFPNDPNAHFVPDEDNSQRTISQLFAQGFFDWLRTAHCRPRIDSVVNGVFNHFTELATAGTGSRIYPNYLYEFDEKGEVLVTNQHENPFLNQTVYDNQLYGISFKAITTGKSTWTVSCRDEVNNLGTICGGKHAGQSMSGNPVNWCDLVCYDGDVDLAKKKKKGMSLGIKPCGAVGADDGVLLNTAYFSKLDGQNLNHQPRKNYYAGGLAVEFRICSPMQIN
jgi:hypothetical protein